MKDYQVTILWKVDPYISIYFLDTKHDAELVKHIFATNFGGIIKSIRIRKDWG